MERTTVSSGTEWESRVGYSRAVRAGPHVHVSGTTATDDDGEIVGEDDAYTQARGAIENVTSALSRAGASVDDVVRTRMFVTDIDRWAEFGRAHREAFADHSPTTTMVEVARLIHPDMLIEIEADAVCRPSG